MSCLKKGGICILEHSSDHGPSGASKLDPFGAALVLMPYLITIWGKGEYCVREILRAPCNKNGTIDINYIINWL